MNLKSFDFQIVKKLYKNNKKTLCRAGIFKTSHGEILTPAFIGVATKATIKSLTTNQIKEIKPEAILANTYHLYFSPGDEIIEKAGGLHNFSGWSGPIMTDSGGFQAFSLGAAFGENISKITKSSSEFLQIAKNKTKTNNNLSSGKALAKITENGVEFRSYKDGSKHFFTPEKSIQIQHNLGADILFAFDECTSPQATYEYQKEAMERTHKWALRSLKEHKKLEQEKTGRKPQVLFGIVQGGRHKDLREESATFLSSLNFDGFGIGGSFSKEDIGEIMNIVNQILPEDKPRHLLGIGEPIDLFMGIENGIDFFDCVAPTRIARHGILHTKNGKINITNAKYKSDFCPIENDCECYTCKNYTKAYLNHLQREKEFTGATLATIHNLHFVINLVRNIRESILNDTFFKFKEKL